MQSTLEQFGVGSLVVSATAGEAPVHRAAEFVVGAAKRRSQPVGFLAAGGAIDVALGLGAESPLADRPLALLSPPLPRRAALDGLLTRAPAWLRHGLSSSNDSRLSDWRGKVLVVRAKEERRFDAVAANALAAGSRRATALVVPGNGFEHAPLHPDQESWRAIADFFRGVVRKQQEIIVPQDTTAPPPP
ncbi:MAG: hypothetical protein V4558_05290 [Gemmatimonadota bacterium]